MKGFIADIEDLTEQNTDFRRRPFCRKDCSLS